MFILGIPNSCLNQTVRYFFFKNQILSIIEVFCLKQTSIICSVWVSLCPCSLRSLYLADRSGTLCGLVEVSVVAH